jgi:hypothetical protein
MKKQLAMVIEIRIKKNVKTGNSENESSYPAKNSSLTL